MAVDFFWKLNLRQPFISAWSRLLRRNRQVPPPRAAKRARWESGGRFLEGFGWRWGWNCWLVWGWRRTGGEKMTCNHLWRDVVSPASVAVKHESRLLVSLRLATGAWARYASNSQCEVSSAANSRGSGGLHGPGPFEVPSRWTGPWKARSLCCEILKVNCLYSSVCFPRIRFWYSGFWKVSYWSKQTLASCATAFGFVFFFTAMCVPSHTW